MKTPSLILHSVLAAVLVVALTGVVQANVWMDENFDGTVVFNQGNGDGYPTTYTLDTWSSNPSITNPVGSVLTHTGAVTSSKSNSSPNSYQINGGQTLACGTNYDNPTNGNFQYVQFAVNVDPIPGSAGTVATFRWNFDSDTGSGASPDFSYYIRLDADGSGNVDIIAGEDLHNSTPVEFTIGQISSTSTWVPLTLQMQKDPGDQNDPRNGSNLIPQGMHFYSPTTSAQIGFATSSAFSSLDWAFTVTSGDTIYVDDFYWEGGIDSVGFLTPPLSPTDPTIQDLTPITPPSAVKDWALY